VKNILKGKLKFVLLLLVLIFILFYYLTHRGKKEEVYVDEYSYMKVEQTDEIGTINLNGYVKANNPIGIFVDKKLKVKEVFIKNGDFVEKGQILMTFDDDETNKLNRSIEKERINLQKIQRDLNTTRELYKLGGASRDEVRNLEDSARVTQLNIDVYDGEITKISRLSTTSSMTGENVLEAEVKTNEIIPNLVPGFKIKAVLQLKSDVKNIIIPKIALQNEEGKYFVYTLDEKNTIKKKIITIKNIVGDNIIVLSGLNPGEEIVLTPDNRLRDGLVLAGGDNHNSSEEVTSVPADKAKVIVN